MNSVKHLVHGQLLLDMQIAIYDKANLGFVNDVWDEVWDKVRRQVWDEVSSEVRDKVRSEVYWKVKSEIG